MLAERKEKEKVIMQRVQAILEHPLYIECLEKNKALEWERIYCRHDLEHFLEVARLAYIFSLERRNEIPKEWIYIVAMLHDIGRFRQYEDGTPHQKASAEIAQIILKDLQFEDWELPVLLDAILEHRESTQGSELAEVIYDADKMSRNCFCCEAIESCNWSREKKNRQILW